MDRQTIKRSNGETNMCDTPESTKTAIHELRKRLDKVESKLDGNGRPGIMERLSSMERAQAVTNRLLLAVFTACVGILMKQFAG